jgi:ribonucleoside-diphosphate reductase alpha chain
MEPLPAHRRQGRQTLPARELWEDRRRLGLRRSGVQYDTTINEWHTCPASGQSTPQPCSEYMFLDDTACNLASLNLMTFRQRRLRYREL